MDKKKLRQSAEGLIVTAAGLWYLVLAIQIRNNPVKTPGLVGYLTEAKFLPVLLSALVMFQGIRLTVALWNGKETSATTGGMTFRSAAVVVLTVAYLLLVAQLGFALPTAAYLTAMLFLVNKGRRPLELLVLSAVYCLVALVLIPGLLGLKLL